MRKATLAEFLEYAVTVPGWVDLERVVKDFQVASYMENGYLNNVAYVGSEELMREELVTMSRSDYEELVINHIAVSEPVAANPILSDLVNKIEQQTAKGISKYGESVNPDNLSFVEWVEHAMEEMVDNLVYMACAKDKVLNEGKLNGKGENHETNDLSK